MFLKGIKNFFLQRKATPPEGFEPVQVKELAFKSGEMTLDLAHPNMAIIAESAVKFFEDCSGINYVSMMFWDKSLGNLELIVQRMDGQTPSQLHQELLRAVGNEIPGESRHETALRYIKAAGSKSPVGIEG